MTDQAIRVVPAGWYEDPASPASRVRWWNGLGWTDHVAAKPDERVAHPIVVDPIILAAPRPRPDDLRALAAVPAPAPSTVPALFLEPETPVTPAHEDATADTRRAARARGELGPRRTGTLGIWLIALLPVIAILLVGLAGYLYLYLSPAPALALVVALIWMVGLLWAVADHRVLRRRGIASASPLWALVLPVIGSMLYLTARRRRIPTAAPLAIFVILVVGAVGVPSITYLTGAAQPAVVALTVQNTIRQDLVSRGIATEVNCPAVLDTWRPGTLYTCDLQGSDGAPGRVWVSFDDYAGHFSWSVAA